MKDWTLPNLPSGDIKDSVKWSSVFPGGMMARGQSFLWRKPSPGRTATPKERGSLRHPCGSRSIVFVNSTHSMTTSMNIQKCQGHELLFKDCETMSPVLEPYRSGLISSFVITATQLLIRVGGTTFQLHSWFIAFNLPSFVIFSDQCLVFKQLF